MTLDTVQVALTPIDTLEVSHRLDERGESWSFNGLEEKNPSLVRKCRKLLLLNIDGLDEVMEVTLNIDGTWSATTHISLGEAK